MKGETCGVSIKGFEGAKSKMCSTTLRCESFSKKNIEKKHLCCREKNYYYLCKSNIYVINLIVDSRNMIKLSKKYEFSKN